MKDRETGRVTGRETGTVKGREAGRESQSQEEKWRGCLALFSVS